MASSEQPPSSAPAASGAYGLRGSDKRQVPARFSDAILSTTKPMVEDSVAAADNTPWASEEAPKRTTRDQSPVTPPGPPKKATPDPSKSPSPSHGLQIPPSAQPQRPTSSKIASTTASRPTARAFVPTVASSSKSRLQPDRDIEFFTRRAVVRDLGGSKPSRLAEEDSTDDNEPEQSEEDAATSPARTIQPSKATKHHNKDETQQSDGSGSETIIDLTLGSPSSSGSPPPPSKKKVVKLAAPAKKTTTAKAKPTKARASKKGKEKERTTQQLPSKGSPSKKASASPEKQTTIFEAVKKVDANEALKRARTAWAKAHKEQEARALAESKGLEYSGPANQASERYLGFLEPTIRVNSERGGGTFIAFNCRCCTPAYTAWRPLNDASTSLLGTHLRTKRSKKAFHQDGEHDDEEEAGIAKFFVKSKTVPPVDTMDKARARQISVGWVSEEARPLSIVEDKWFIEWLTPHRQTLRPSRKRVARDVGEIHAAMGQHIKQRLQQVGGTIHFALDIWTSSNGHSFLGIIGCWQEQGQAQRHVIDMVPFMLRHTAENIAISVRQVIRRYQLEEKIWFVAGDNASYNTAMIKILGKDDSLARFDGERSQIRCIAHVMNLISTAIIKPFNKAIRYVDDANAETELATDWESDEELVEGSEDEDSETTDDDDNAMSTSLHPGITTRDEDEVLVTRALEHHKASWKLRSSLPSARASDVDVSSGEIGLQIKQLAWFARKLRYNTRLRDSFKRACANYALPKPYTLIRDVATRWNSTYDMIERALKLWDAIIAWQTENVGLIPPKYRLKRVHKAGFQTLLHLLEPLSVATAKFSSKQNPTIGGVIGVFESLDAHYRKLAENETLSETWRDAARRAGAVCSEYYGLADATDAYYLAILLHPNMRIKFMKAMVWEQEWIDKATHVLRETYEQFYKVEPEMTQPDSSAVVAEEDEELDFMELKMRKMAAEHKEAAEEPDPIQQWIDGYIAAKRGEKTDPLEWWWREHEKGNHRLGLTQLALDVYSCPASSVDVERLFSKAGQHCC
ncbi:hypothetical protein A4X13_0g8068 [Tilletia indica]|uniref:HAT C-terminal dimerisation domain-containing protein n=1 Tax=Tilletia indica TaxID=43049 RepID=A0A177TX42_9BASI|nr:hypothetical protein A4X13_0g8068 [Tilletia indica]